MVISLERKDRKTQQNTISMQEQNLLFIKMLHFVLVTIRRALRYSTSKREEHNPCVAISNMVKIYKKVS